MYNEHDFLLLLLAKARFRLTFGSLASAEYLYKGVGSWTTTFSALSTIWTWGEGVEGGLGRFTVVGGVGGVTSPLFCT